MKHLLQIVSDIFSIALAAVVLGGAYLYTNPHHVQTLLAQWHAWRTLGATMPSVGIADAILIVAMVGGLLSTVVLFTRGRALLRGPVTIKLVR